MLDGLGSRLAFVAAFALAASCSSDDDGAETGNTADAGTTSVGGRGGGGSTGGSSGRGGGMSSPGASGETSDAGSSAGEVGGDGAGPGAGGAQPVGGSGASGECGLSLATKSCQGQGHCEWTNEAECQTGYCDCANGSWACVQEQTNECGGVCPAAQDAVCNSSCSGTVSGCQCSCGGFNYSSCSCVGGEWACLGC